MSAEGQPTDIPTPKDERDEVKALEEQLARKKSEADQLEAMGKYDVTAPNVGEETYQSYLDKRPKDGVIRDSDDFRQTETGQYASREAYSQQVAGNRFDPRDVSAMRGIESDSTERKEYQDMNKIELAKAAAEAMSRNDRADVEEIRSIYETSLMEKLTKENTAQEDRRYNGTDIDGEYKEQLENFDKLIARLAETNSIEDPSSAEADDQSDSTETEPDSDKANEIATGTKVEITGTDGETKEATVESTFTSPDGRVVYEVTGSDGSKTFVPAEQVTVPEKNETSAEIEVGDKVGFKKSDGEYVEGELVSVIRLANEEYDVYTVKTEDGEEFTVSHVELAKEELPDPQIPEDDEVDDLSDINFPDVGGKDADSEEKLSFKEKAIKNLKILFGGPKAWKAEYETARFMKRDLIENMSDEEREAQQKKNRRRYILGGVGIFIAGGITGVLVAKGYMDPDQAMAINEGLGGGDGVSDAVGDGTGGGVPPIEAPELATEPIPDMKIDGWFVDGDGVQQNNAADIFHDVLGYSRGDVSSGWLGRLAEQAGVDWKPGNTLVFEGNLSDDNNENLRSMLEYAKANNIKP